MFYFKVLTEMLRVGPWNRLPLTIRWLKEEYKMDFDPLKQPPIHMPIVYGPVTSQKMPKETVHRCQKSNSDLASFCSICSGLMVGMLLFCAI